jgi:hypothetical protein
MTSDQTQARIQIQHTLGSYCTSVDSGDVDGVVASFAEQGHLELSGGARANGRSAIRDFYTPVIGANRPDRLPDGSPPLLRHHLTTSRVEFLDAATAQAWTYFMSLTRHGLDHSGRYVDRFERVGERWLIADRRIVVEWYAHPSWYQLVRLQAGKNSA